MKAASVALSALGMAASCFGLYAQYIAASHNTRFQMRNFDGSTENFGPLDAAMNYLPLGITALVAVGIGAAWASRNLRVAMLFSLAQMLWLFAFAPGAWIT